MGYPNAQSNPDAAIPVWIAGNGGVPPGLVFKRFAQVTDLSEAVGLTFQAGESVAIVQVNGGIVRYRRDGTSPTGSVGMLMYATGPAQSFEPSDNLEFIEATDTTGSLNVEFYGAA